MKRSKLLEKLKGYLDAEQREQLTKYDSLKRVLEKLRDKEIKLRDKLESEQDEKVRDQIRNKLDVLLTQYQKGIRLQDELNQEKNKV